MPNKENRNTPNRSFWLIGYTALAWNIIGIVTYLLTITISAEALALMSIEERALYTEVPLIISVAYAVAVFGGTLACILLLLKKPLSVTVFVVSLVAIVIQMGHTLFISSLLEIQGVSALVIPLSVITVAIYLAWYSNSVRRKGWLN